MRSGREWRWGCSIGAMHWLDQVFGFAVVLLVLGLPLGAFYAAHRLRTDRALTGWRVWAGRAGALYSLLLLAMVIGWFFWPHPGEWGERIATVRFAPIGFRAGAIGLIFALVGRGRIRLGIALAAIGACAFWFMLEMML